MSNNKYSAAAVGGQGENVTEQINEYGGENLLDAGLQATAWGFRIFPCSGWKEPLTPHGFYDGTTAEAQIRSWAKSYPGALWGYALPENIVVIDLDMKNGLNGIREFERLQGCKPDEFAAPRVATATGGVHIYSDAAGRDFKNSASEIAPGIDTKTEGGYVIIPSGKGSGYRWLTSHNTPKPPTPKWAEVALQQTVDFVPSAEARSYQGCSPFGDAILSGACETIANAPGGQQAVILNRRSYVVGQYIGGGLIERDIAIEALVASGLCMVNTKPKNWTAKQVHKKVTDAVRAGMKKPLDGEESFRLMEEVHRRYAENSKLNEDMEELLTALDAQRDEWADAGHWPDATCGEAQQQGPMGERTQRNGSKTGTRPLVRRMGKSIPAPVAFTVEALIHEIGTGMIVSKWFSGKTYVAMSLSASVATGVAFAGRKVLRKGAVLWFAAEGAWEVDKRIRAAVKALGCDPDEQPVYVQVASVPKLLSDGGEQSVMDIVRQAQQMAKAEFGVPLALIVIDTMIKSAGYRKSENDSVEVNNTIQVMENISVRAKCFVLALDHMGKNEELGARGSSDKPSSVDVYIELKTNGGVIRTFNAIKIKGEKGDEQVDFTIVGATLEDGQTTACIQWDKWNGSGDASRRLNGNAKLLLECVRLAIAHKGQQRIVFYGEPERRCVQKKQIYAEFCRKHKQGQRMAFTRSWRELVKVDLVAAVEDENSAADMDMWVYLEKEYE